MVDANGFKQRKLMMFDDMQPRVYRPIPLRIQLRVPPLTMETVREYFKLPDQYCEACTLREGTVITLIILQVVSVLTVSALTVLLMLFYEDTEYYWLQKFKDDFDPYIENENMDLINSLARLWDELFLAVIIAESSYFVTGLGVMYALMKKTAHPAWHLPWLVLTALLVATNFFISFVLFVSNCIFGTYRYISVTWDILPMILTFLYALFWYYSWTTVLAHYKRRRIVKYWRDSRKFTGSSY